MSMAYFLARAGLHLRRMNRFTFSDRPRAFRSSLATIINLIKQPHFIEGAQTIQLSFNTAQSHQGEMG